MSATATLDMFSMGAPRLRRIETPIARQRDPDSSHRAAKEITVCGARAAQQAQAVSAVKQFPGRTSQELCELTGLDRYMLARRLPECITANGVRKGVQRRCGVTGKTALTWWPA